MDDRKQIPSRWVAFFSYGEICAKAIDKKTGETASIDIKRHKKHNEEKKSELKQEMVQVFDSRLKNFISVPKSVPYSKPKKIKILEPSLKRMKLDEEIEICPVYSGEKELNVYGGEIELGEIEVKGKGDEGDHQ